VGVCCQAICQDGDGDGYGLGMGCPGPDCNDSDPACYQGACCDGNTTCQGLQICMAMCPPGDQTCTDACYQAGTATAQGLWDALETCITANNCQDDRQCIQDNCPSELIACANDA
jgi:hypothetical protein